MNIIRIQYTVASEFAETNKKNIANVMGELRSANHPQIRYSSYVFGDGKTFMHFDHFENEEAHNVLTGLESFKKFSDELLASHLEVEPKLELLSLVGSYPIVT